MDQTSVIMVLLAVAVIVLGVVAGFALLRGRGRTAAGTDLADRLAASQAQLAGRLDQMAKETVATRAELRKALDERLSDVAKRVGDKLTEQGGQEHVRVEGRLARQLAPVGGGEEMLSRFVRVVEAIVGLAEGSQGARILAVFLVQPPGQAVGLCEVFVRALSRT